MSANYLESEFLLGAASKEHFPELDLPEIAFAGRSNVGKSSLINSVVYRKNMARTSGKPGKTQEINFFKVDDSWVLVDMPGYGYSSKGKESRLQFKKLIEDYLINRKSVQLVCCLIDSRHDPTEKDLALIESMENRGQKYLIILTKIDKLSQTKIKEREEQINHLVSKCVFNIDVLPYSSHTKEGRDQLLGIIKSEVKEWNTRN